MGQMNAVCSAPITEAPGFAARDRLFREIEELSVSIGKLETKLGPICYSPPTDPSATGCGGGANSEYFSAIFDAAARVRSARAAVEYLFESVEL